MPAILQMILQFILGRGVSSGIGRLLAGTALPGALKTALPVAGELGVWTAPAIYEAATAPRADDAQISSNQGQMAMLNNALASPPPPPDNLQALMELMTQESARSGGQGDDLTGLLQQQVI